MLAIVVLILALSHIDPDEIANRFRQAAPVRLIGGSLIFIGVVLAAVWIVMWAAYVFADRPTPVEPDAFRLIAALDLSLMVPALTVGGLLLWRRIPWGYFVGTMASVQAALYLFVLSVNSLIAIQRGFADVPGELPIWGTLTIFTTSAAVSLLANVRQERVELSVT